MQKEITQNILNKRIQMVRKKKTPSFLDENGKLTNAALDVIQQKILGIKPKSTVDVETIQQWEEDEKFVSEMLKFRIEINRLNRISEIEINRLNGISETKKMFVKHDPFFESLPSDKKTEQNKNEIFDQINSLFHCNEETCSIRMVFKDFDLTYDNYHENGGNKDLDEDFLWDWLDDCKEKCKEHLSMGITGAMEEAKMNFIDESLDVDDDDLLTYCWEHL